MVRNEERAWKSPGAYFEYEEIDWSPQESSVSREIETSEGTFGRLMTVDGGPPSVKRRRKETHQLEKFARDPEARKTMAQGEEEDVERRMELLQEFPDAFRFSADGPETNGIVRLKFLPNPEYRSKTHNGLALRSTEGRVWIDRPNERLVKIEGTVMQDVTVGWGFVVKVHRGSQFSWQQAEVSPGIWELTQLNFDVKGRILLVKNLSLQSKETHRAFKRVSDRLDTAQAVAMLLGRNTGMQASAR